MYGLSGKGGGGCSRLSTRRRRRPIRKNDREDKNQTNHPAEIRRINRARTQTSSAGGHYPASPGSGSTSDAGGHFGPHTLSRTSRSRSQALGWWLAECGSDTKSSAQQSNRAHFTGAGEPEYEISQGLHLYARPQEIASEGPYAREGLAYGKAHALDRTN